MDKKRIVCFIIFSLLVLNSVSALRISPARISADFKPGMELEASFRVDGTLDRELEIYARGDFAEYVEFDPTTLFKQGEFIAKLSLPEEIGVPGPKRLSIGVKELLDVELVNGIGTAVGIEASIYLFVPYPGKYLEVNLKGHDINIGDPITFELSMQSRGKDDINAKPRIEIYSEEGLLLDTIDFKERNMKSGDLLEVKNIFETNNYGSGSYYAMAKVSYGGGISESRYDFRVGELSINIINHTQQMTIGGIRPFWIEIESGWNDYIDGAFADITFYNQTAKFETFRTSPANLEPWESYKVRGYLETDGFSPGIYNAMVLVTYYGKDRGKSRSKVIEVEFVAAKEERNWMMWYIVGGSILGLVMLLLIIYLVIKNAKRKK